MSVEGKDGGLLGASPFWKPDTAELQYQGGGPHGQGTAASLAVGQEEGTWFQPDLFFTVTH